MKACLYPLCLMLLCGNGSVNAADSDPTPTLPQGAKAQLEDLIEQVKWKMRKGHKTERRLAAELKRFDQLLEEHAGEKTDDVAEILFLKAMLYVQVFDEPEKGLPILRKMKEEFPETTQGRKADEVIASVEQKAAAVRLRKELVEGRLFPELEVNDMDGKPLRLADYRGKVVLLNFWATWDGPYRAELTNILKAYRDYHEKGFEIIGINLDEDEERVRTFLKDQGITWPQYFDGQGWNNKVATRFAVNSVPATYLIDQEGKIIARNLRGNALATALARVLDQQPNP